MRTLLLAALLCCAAPAAFAQQTTSPPEHAAMGHCAAAGGEAGQPTRSMMSSPLGDYGMNRDASGTSWQPDAASGSQMRHDMAGSWMVMRHTQLDLIYDNQGGPRGDEQTFVAGMVMLGASREAGPGVLNLRGMLSPDPLMGKRGYPLLLQAGETANGVNHLIDRQHPHDLFMELSASYSLPVGDRQSVYIYGGLPGEPAFGPPAFMHRPAASMSPEAPISHHWFDSTHITFGVLTAGYVHDSWKIEASSFKGREPDENRYNIESPKLDSWSTRLSWNPTRNWAAQLSYAELKSPEQLDPDEDQNRVSTSVLYGTPYWNATLAWASKKNTTGPHLDALLAEAAWTPNDRWTVFLRAEQVEQNELDADHTPYRVGKASLGAVYEVPVSDRIVIGIGGLVSALDVPAPLSASYGGSPTSGMGFLRLRLR